jgi:hypothetical protein
LSTYTQKYPDCIGIALNVENEKEYTLKAVIIKQGKILDSDWIKE